MANPVGPPRQHDRQAIMEGFVKYAATHAECLTLSDYTIPLMIPSRLLFEWAQEDRKIADLYEIGKEIVGRNRLAASLNTDPSKPRLHQNSYDKKAHHYNTHEFNEQKFENRREKIFERKLDKLMEIGKTISEDEYDRIMNSGELDQL